MIQHTPEPTVVLSLTVKSAAEALAFYNKAFDAVEVYRLPAPDGGVAHAEFTIGNTKICISDEAPDHHAAAIPQGQMASCVFAISSEDCDTAHKLAVSAGASSLIEPADRFWGCRYSMVLDPYGYRWGINQQLPASNSKVLNVEAKNSVAVK